jgi:hypothetical protein
MNTQANVTDGTKARHSKEKMDSPIPMRVTVRFANLSKIRPPKIDPIRMPIPQTVVNIPAIEREMPKPSIGSLRYGLMIWFIPTMMKKMMKPMAALVRTFFFPKALKALGSKRLPAGRSPSLVISTNGTGKSVKIANV